MPLDQEEGEMSFLDHLEELRWHLIRSVVAVLLMATVAFIFKNIVFDEIIFAPKSNNFITYRLLCKMSHWVGAGETLCMSDFAFELINIDMAGQFSIHIWTSIIAGIIVAFPFIVWEFWKFLKPALYPHEQKQARGMVIYTSMLFLLGVMFGYFLLTPLSIQFLGNYSISEQIYNRINLGSFISTVSLVTLSCGIVFELPVIIYFLSRVGIVTPQFLKTYRKHALIIILLLSAIITPPDIMSQMLVSIPLFVLYEISILISERVVKKLDSNQLPVVK
jgi:sec-independent protein translocase protein TatC